MGLTCILKGPFMYYMGKRKKAEYTIADIAEAAGVHYRTALRHEAQGRYVYGDLASVVRYINVTRYAVDQRRRS